MKITVKFLGVYPFCECANNGVFEDGFCHYCPENSNGTFPVMDKS